MLPPRFGALLATCQQKAAGARLNRCDRPSNKPRGLKTDASIVIHGAGGDGRGRRKPRDYGCPQSPGRGYTHTVLVPEGRVRPGQ